MVLLQSKKKELGTPAPQFDLKSVDGQSFTLESFSSRKVLVILFMCNHCPYVKAIEARVIQFARDFGPKGVQVVGICSNDPTDYPDDAPGNLKKRWEEKQYGFPYLLDETQETARAYGAVCTPDIYVYDADRKLAYHGRFDDNWQEPDEVTRHDLVDAVERLLAGEKPSDEQSPSMGCSIKWKKEK